MPVTVVVGPESVVATAGTLARPVSEDSPTRASDPQAPDTTTPPARGAIRASDQDRESAAAEIREHFAVGRLDEAELNERLDAVYQARTLAQLNELRADLPQLPPPKPDPRAEIAERRAILQRRLIQRTGQSLSLFAVCVVIWLASGAQGNFWPVWALIFPAMVLLRNGWGLYGPDPDLDRVEADLTHDRRRIARDADRHARHRGRAGLGP